MAALQVNAIGAQLRDLINSGLTRWRMAVEINKWTPPRKSRGIPQVNKRGASLMAALNEGKTLKELTLVFCRRRSSSSVDDGCNELLLGLKKRGFGEGKWNGFGGKVEAGETVEEAAKRELLEEAGVTAQRLSLRGQLTFNVPSYPSTMRVFVYEAVSYVGEPRESEEMRPRWFRETDLPFKEMWADDEHWMPLFLAGKFFQGEFDFSDEQTIIDFKLRDLPSAQTIQETQEIVSK